MMLKGSLDFLKSLDRRMCKEFLLTLIHRMWLDYSLKTCEMVGPLKKIHFRVFRL